MSKVPPRHRSPLRWSAGTFATYGILAAWSLVCLFPLYWVFATSFKSVDEIRGYSHYVPFVDYTPSLDGWMFIFTDRQDNLRSQYLNSIVVALASTGISLASGGLAVYALTRLRYAISLRVFGLGVLRNDGIMAAFLVTRLLPPVLLVVPLYMLAQRTGTFDTDFILIVVYSAINLPVAVWLLRPVFGARASEHEEAALLDGASHLQIFATIVVPMAVAGIATVGLIIFILCWNEFLFASVLAPGRAMTLPPWLASLKSFREAQIIAEEDELIHFSAGIVLTILPLLAITGLVLRFPERMAIGQRTAPSR